MMMDHGDASITVNGRAWRSSGQWAGNHIHGLGGIDFSPEKHQETDQDNKALVVSVDLTTFHTTCTIRFTPTPERCSKLIDAMELAQHDDFLSPKQAESLLGKRISHCQHDPRLWVAQLHSHWSTAPPGAAT